MDVRTGTEFLHTDSHLIQSVDNLHVDPVPIIHWNLLGTRHIVIDADT